MADRISSRLSAVVDALPVKEGMRVLEIGCGPGAAAREIVRRTQRVQVVAIDRSAKAIAQAIGGSQLEIATGRLQFRCAAIESFALDANEKRFDIVFAVRVGALDGRHPEIEAVALKQIAKLLTSNGRLLIDAGSPLKEIPIAKYSSSG